MRRTTTTRRVRAYSQARYDYLTNVLTLKQQAGRLSEHDLDRHRRPAHREGRMSMRLLPKEPIMLRDTTAQDRVIEPKNLWKRHRKLMHRRRRSPCGRARSC